MIGPGGEAEWEGVEAFRVVGYRFKPSGLKGKVSGFGCTVSGFDTARDALVSVDL